jgi:transaldolase
VKLLVDSASLDDVRAARALGILDGVTTNPSLLARSGVRLDDFLASVCELVDGPVCVPARGIEADAIVAEGRRLASLHDNVVIKISIQSNGLIALAKLHSEGVRTHATLCCTANQALLAARAGADFVSPVVARLEDTGANGFEVVAQILEIYDHYDFDTQVMVASVRTPLHVQEAAVLGADACTMPLAVLRQLVEHPLTTSMQERFNADWERA